MKKAIVDIRQQNAERADADIAAARARGENPPARPPTPEEERRAFIDASRAQLQRDLDEYLAQAEASGTLTDEQRAFFAHQRRVREGDAPTAAQAGEPVPQSQTQGPSRDQESAQDDKVEITNGANGIPLRVTGGSTGLQPRFTGGSTGLQASERELREAPTALPKALVNGIEVQMKSPAFLRG